jgi:glutamate-1-semialdehyde aminotransferase
VFEAPKPGFLEGLRKLCTRKGALLVFDEMWTGFRLAVGGAQQAFGVTADLACFSKAIANGMPLSVLTGRRDVMRMLDKDVFFFTTFGGEALSLAAAQPTIHKLRRQRVPEHIAELGARTLAGLRELVSELDMPYLKPAGLPYRTMLAFAAGGGEPLELKSFVQQELLRHGILWGGMHHYSLAHSAADVDYLLAAYRDVFLRLRAAVADRSVAEQLRGATLAPVFRRTTKFHTRPRPSGGP